MTEIAPFTGYVYPNETIIPWGVLIVIYPYLTGLVAGAFTVSSFYHVFGMQQFKPVARFALLTSLSVMLFVPTPLLLHLGHAERAMNSMITPHLTSAFAMFGFFAAFYMVLLILECWFVFRVDNVVRAQNSTGLARAFYRAVTLWSDDVSPNARAIDGKLLLILAIVGIPSAHGLHGYIGFVYGSLKARQWWESDLMPVIFLFSAIVSGIALLMVLYVLTSKLRRVPIDHACLKGLTFALWGFLMFTVILEALAFANQVYKGREGIDMVMEYVQGPLFVRYFVLQFGFGALLPITVMSIMIARNVRGRAFLAGATICALLVLMNVLLMRWNVVIGGQEIAKTGKGLLTYPLPLWGRESLVSASILVMAPFALLWLLTRLFPPWADPPRST
ncbi:MAG TPA: NrfD/PsrC family molybdoenzyme membrane anchor subunit [Xanthomonadales bacterium]|nr:NrfD/PsrC family molybdoenzyme membrane anchor subunit [Xanthomonadales bacterium]